ncbi:MAG: RidA family protein [Rhodothermales bacterium]
MQPIQTPRAPAPAGHYSQAVVHDGLVYVSGQLPIDPNRDTQAPGSIEDQTRQALHNVREILEAAGSSLGHVVQMTIYIADISLWSRVNAVYAEMMGEYRPARAVVPTKALHYGYMIEIQAVAATS